MSYYFQRKLRRFSEFWDDPEGRNPTEISENPVQPVALVNAPNSDVVRASIRLTSVANQNIQFQFSDGRPISGNLSPDRIWILRTYRGVCYPHAVWYCRFVPLLSEREGDFGGVAGVAAQLPVGQPDLTEYPNPDEGLVLPFGASNFQWRPDLTSTACGLTLVAEGYLRGSTFDR